MKRSFLLAMLVLVARILCAQNITTVEYFIDTDPGYGNGNPVNITPAVGIKNLTFSIDLSVESDGFHTLFMRARDANGLWSLAYSKPFYKLSTVSITPVAADISKIEYFIDHDPGYGAATDVPISSAQSISNQTFTIPLTTVADGFHMLFVRTQDENGNWSPAYSKPFYKLGTETVDPTPDITKVEYFIDTDPGFGAGTNLPVTAAPSIVDLSFEAELNGLSEGEHTINVRAQNADGQWSVLASQSFTICNHPGVTAQQAEDVSSSQMTASWTASPGSSSYEFELSTDHFKTLIAGYDPFVIDPPVTSLIIKGLAPGTMYQYRVRAVGSCVSVPSNSIEFSTLITAPSSQPANLGISSVTTDSYTIHFSPASGTPTGYLVIRKTGANPTFIPTNNVTYTVGQVVGDGKVAHVGAEVSFDETGLSADTQYYYDVFAYNQNGSQISYLQTSPLENAFSTLALPPAGQAQNIAFTNVGYSGFEVSFTAPPDGANGYLVLRKAGSAPTGVPADGVIYSEKVGSDDVAYRGPETTFLETTLLENTTYFYAVYAYNGTEGSVNYLTASPLQGSQTTPLQPPVFSAATEIWQDHFTIHWTSTTGVIEYRLDVSADGFATLLAGFDNLAVAGTSHTITGLDAGTAYQYRMRAVTSGGETLNSAVMEQYTVPPTPGLLDASDIGQTSFTLRWTLAKGADEYFIDVSKFQNFSSVVTGYGNKPVGNVSTHLIEGLDPGETYYYRVRAANSGGTSPSSTPTGSVLLLPPTPLALDATNATSTTFKAKWEAVPGATGYLLDVSLANDDFNPSLENYTSKSIVGITEELVTDLLPNTAYKYRVRAVNASGPSASSLPVSVSTLQVGTGNPLVLTTPIYATSFEGPSANISVQIQGGTPPYTMSFHSRKIAQRDFYSKTLASSGSATYQVQIEDSMLDELGLEFYFEVLDVNGFENRTGKHFIYRSLPSIGMNIPFTSSGGTAQSYEIFSIPYAVEDNLIASIFDELGEYKKSQWRLVRYQGGEKR